MIQCQVFVKNSNLNISNDDVTEQRNVRTNSSPNSSSSNSNSDTPLEPLYTEKVLNIIRNWKIKFSGHKDPISVDEFVYRINVLTSNTLKGDFTLLCKHAHVLFEGKALEWYWRYHCQDNNLDWVSLTNFLRRHYKTEYTDYDILDDIRKRRQKPDESFDDYFEVISTMTDKLKNPISDTDLKETILRNLKVEIRHELLHLNISSVSDIRREVRKHEKFVNDLHNINSRKSIKGKITELLVSDTNDNSDVSLDSDLCAIQS